jgi:hypothetical protein
VWLQVEWRKRDRNLSHWRTRFRGGSTWFMSTSLDTQAEFQKSIQIKTFLLMLGIM